jgi:hypothetical protein
MWLENYINKNVIYDLVLRSPFLFLQGDLKTCLNDSQGKMEITFSKLKNKDEISLILYSLLNDFSLGNKAYISKIRGFSGKKVYKLAVKFQDKDLLNFLDFFLNLIIKGLKRRFIVLKSSINEKGVLNLRFSSLSELEIDDYLFFDIDEWQGSLNIFINFSSVIFIRKLLASYFLNIFNIKKFSKYEVFTTKG